MKRTEVHSVDNEIAEDTTVVEAIRYIENTTNKVIKDLNFDRLKQLEEADHCLKLKLEGSQDSKNKFARRWLLAMRFMHSFSEQIKEHNKC